MDAPFDESTLIQRASRGDQEAFSALFHRYQPMIYAFAYRLCLDRAEAQDVAQETFVRAARSLDRFVAEGKVDGFRPWLYRIALNAARDSLRRGSRRKALDDEIAFRQTREEQVRESQSSRIGSALAALPEDLRQAVVLVFYEDMSHAQAAALLGCAEVTVSWRIFRAKRQLRKKLVSPVDDHADER